MPPGIEFSIGVTPLDYATQGTTPGQSKKSVSGPCGSVANVSINVGDKEPVAKISPSGRNDRRVMFLDLRHPRYLRKTLPAPANVSYVKFDFIYYILLFGLINKISNLIIEEGGVLGFEPDIENLPIIR